MYDPSVCVTVPVHMGGGGGGVTVKQSCKQVPITDRTGGPLGERLVSHRLRLCVCGVQCTGMWFC